MSQTSYFIIRSDDFSLNDSKKIKGLFKEVKDFIRQHGLKICGEEVDRVYLLECLKRCKYIIFLTSDNSQYFNDIVGFSLIEVENKELKCTVFSGKSNSIKDELLVAILTHIQKTCFYRTLKIMCSCDHDILYYFLEIGFNILERYHRNGGKKICEMCFRIKY